jgi:hypothetical protein
MNMDGAYFWTTVDSTAIHWLAYFTNGGVLDVSFSQGSTYRYFNVPLQMVVNLLMASSPGAYYNVHFKGRFEERP